MKKPVKNIEPGQHEDLTYQMNETGEYRDTWRIFRIMSEFVEGYQFLSSFTKEVTVLGSARFSEDNLFYKVARDLGKLLGKNGYTTITGGGPGIMEAANRGAMEVGGESVGLNIQLPFEQRINPYVKKSMGFYYFFTRKVMLTSPADSFVYFPGGFGTLDELLEVVDNIESGKICRLPIILVGKSYWEPLLEFLRDKVCELAPVHSKEMEKWHLVDTAEEAFAILHNSGPLDRACELSPLYFSGTTKHMDWRIFRIMAELVEGFDFLTGLVEDVTVLGTKNIHFESYYYKSAYNLGRSLAENGYTVITGGAAGIAEAVNKGTMEAGGKSFGIGMEVHGKARINQYVTKSIVFKFPFTRKLIVTSPSKAFVFYPGGFGTLHQLFEVLTLIQTKKMQWVPIILIDTQFWRPLDDFIRNTLAKNLATIAPDDAKIYTIVDSEDEAMVIINKFRNKVSKKLSLSAVGHNS